MKKKILSLMLMVSLAASLAACGQDSGKNSNNTDLSKTETEASSGQTGEEETTLVYGSADYTRINPAMDEHGEINPGIISRKMGVRCRNLHLHLSYPGRHPMA